MVLLALLLVLSCCSLFVGVINLTPAELLAGNFEQIEIFLISRLLTSSKLVPLGKNRRIMRLWFSLLPFSQAE